ncbi:MAG: hypothetical protein WAU45_07935 [Blastocatellia bacterium]
MKTDTLCLHTPCDTGIAERPRYFAGQLITREDLTLEQDYFRSKLRLHNRLLHGWGVVCGARVCLVPKTGNGNSAEPWKVAIKPGYILGPYGDEINIDCTRVFDLRTRCITGVTGEPCVEAADPWCSEVIEQPESGVLYVAVRYKETPTRPVRVQPVGCGCDDTKCEYSRLRDGYEICVLNGCPDSRLTPPGRDDLFTGEVPDCPACPDEPWVVLAEVHLDKDGRITKIDNCSCRRLVASFAGFWWECAEPIKHEPSTTSDVRVVRIEAPATELEAGKDHEVKVAGSNLNRITAVAFGNDVKVESFKADESGAAMGAKIVIAAGAAPGPRAMEFKDSAGKGGQFPAAITVARPPVPAPVPAPLPPKARRGKSKTEDKA